MSDATSQLTDADVSRLYKERKYDEIVKARREGRLRSIEGEEPFLDISDGRALTDADLTRLTREGRHAEIVEAQRAGRIPGHNGAAAFTAD